MRLEHRLIPLLGLALLCPARPAFASWPSTGLPVAVAPCEEYLGSVVQDGAGGCIIFWADNRTCGDFNLFAQRITSEGLVAAGWDSIGVAICALPGEQARAAAVPDGQGGAVVVWADSRSGGYKLYAQRIDTTGVKLWAPDGVPLSLSPGSQSGFSVESDREGGAVVCWTDMRFGRTDGSPHHHALPNLFAQHIDPSGTRVWPDTGAVVCADSAGQFSPSIMTDEGRGYLIAWFDGRGSAYLQHLDSGGQPLLAKDGVPIPGRFLGFPARDGSGGLISAFNWGSDDSEDIFVQRIRADGSPVWPLDGMPIVNAPYKQECTAMIADGSGGGFVAWHDLRNGHDWDVYVQRFTGSGVPAAGWPVNGVPVCTLPAFQVSPFLVGDDSGGCIVMWCDARDSLNLYDIYAQRLTPEGNIAPGWPINGLAICRAPGNQVLPTGVRDGAGGVMLAWSDYRVYADVYAQHASGTGVVGDTTVPPILTPAGAIATLDTVRVAWLRGASALFEATVQRSQDGTSWQPMGQVRPGPSGRLEFMDTRISPGQSYSYRLAIGNPEEDFGETSTTVPNVFPLEIRSLAPNPASGTAILSLSAPTKDPITIDVLDIQGRRRSHEVVIPSQLAPITRALTLGSRLDSGLYFVRITQLGHSAVKRISILR